MPIPEADREAVVSKFLGDRGSESPAKPEEEGEPMDGGAFTVDAALFADLADKKVGDISMLPVKITQIKGRMMTMVPDKGDGMDSEHEDTPKPVQQDENPGQGGQEQGGY